LQVEYGLLKPPQDVKSKIDKEIYSIPEVRRNKKLKLSDNKLQAIERDIKSKYTQYKTETAALRRRLVSLNEILEGVVPKTNFPYEGASNITTRYATGMARAFRSTFNKSLYASPDIFIASGKADKKAIDDAQEVLNRKFSLESDGLDMVKDGTMPCFRDGVFLISAYWEREIEKASDYRAYKTANDFIKDYSLPEDAGLSQEEYDALLDKFIVNEEFEYRVEYKYDFLKNNGLKFQVIPLAEFIFWPTWVHTISDMKLYGRSYSKSQEDILLGSKEGLYYERKAYECIARQHGMKTDEWSASRNFIDGLSVTQTEKTPYELADVVYKADLDDDGIPEKYLVVFDVNNFIVLSVESYPIMRNIDFVVSFRFVKRDNRFIGASMAADGEDLFNLIDTIHRHRNNIRSLVAAPVVFMNETMKEHIDPSRSENVIRPGMVIWGKPPFDNIARQMILQNFDQPGNSADEENLAVRYLELAIGPTQALSGKESPSDPRSPMGKTIALINQANLRIDDYMSEFSKSFPDLARLVQALTIQYSNDEEDVRKLSINGIIWTERKRSVTMSPEFAMQRIQGLMTLYAMYLKMGGPQNNIATELWNRMVLASGEDDTNKLTVETQQPPAETTPGLPVAIPGGVSVPMGASAPPTLTQSTEMR